MGINNFDKIVEICVFLWFFNLQVTKNIPSVLYY